ncbi:hypothetical protein MaudCBS49596_003700 [Microsporum audouinii]
MARRAMETEADTPQSPPKRVTRARVRSTTTKEEAKVTAIASTTTTTTAKRGRPRTKPDTSAGSSKAKTASASDDLKKRSRRTASTKTAACSLDDADNSSDDEMNIVSIRATAATRSSTRRMATSTSCNSSVASEPKKRASRVTRKKPQPVAADVSEPQDLDDDDDDELAENIQPAKQKTVKITTAAARKAKAPAVSKTAKAPSRPAAKHSALSSTKPEPSVAGKAKPAAVRKKVTFLDITEHSDKENQPLVESSKCKGRPETGLTAKPVRRGASTRQKPLDVNEDRLERKKEPLSPKKATQVAKSGSSGSSGEDEDDVFSSKRHSKSPQQSPAKTSSVPSSFASPARRIDFTQAARPVSQGPAASDRDTATPSKSEKTLFANTELRSSPAKRPPPSPFQPAIKESPRKAPIFRNEPRPEQEMVGQPKVSPFKVSPKKGPGMSFIQPSLDAPLSPTKTRTSPLKSPARRPPSPMKMPPPPPASERSPVQIYSPQAHESINTHFNREGTSDGFMEEMDVSTICGADRNVLDENIDTTESQLYSLRLQSPTCDSFTEETTPPNRRETVLRYDGVDMDTCINDAPPASLPRFEPPHPQDFVYRDEMIHEDSDGEFEASPTKQPLWRSNFRSESPEIAFKNQDLSTAELGYTPLADKLNRWAASSPEKQRPRKYQRRGLFSPDVHYGSDRISTQVPERRRSSRIHQFQSSRESIKSIVEDEVPAIEDLSIHTDPSTSLEDEDIADSIAYEESTVDSPLRSRSSHTTLTDQLSECSEGYGDENSPPTITINSALFEENVESPAASPLESIPISMSVTPVRRNPDYPRTIHTVSKVPLKGESDESIKVPRKRTRSLCSNTTSPTPILIKSRTLPSPSKSRTPLKSITPASPEDNFMLPERSKVGTWSGRISPVKHRSPVKEKRSESEVLKGAVVYVDVHTAEGADASGIFIELLSQMGARCVKSWKWNPRTSLSPVDGAEPQDSPKVGITHVIHKDGGVRTLQKVREANGVVKCVGVGWVLDCERENRWVDEANYAVDISMIPRGGNKRRKSMEPRALSNQHGILAKPNSSTSSSNSRRSGADMETLQELRRLSPIPRLHPSRRDSIDPTAFEHGGFDDSENIDTPRRPQTPSNFLEAEEPQTPGGEYSYSFDFDGTAPPSPTTPYYLSEGAKLIQQTCPPKQLRQGLFPISGNIDDEKSEKLRIRLEAARRKSLVWKPRVGSPLGKGYM